MAKLDDVKVAVIATDGVEEVELTKPVDALWGEGANVIILSDHSGQIQTFNHLNKGNVLPVDEIIDRADSSYFDALFLPGGVLNVDMIRTNMHVKNFIQQFEESGKPMAVICYAPWELISAGVAKGRTLTSYYTIQDDVRNAGANWVDQEVVLDKNLVTSRQPNDIPAFNNAMIVLFSKNIQS